MTYEDSRKYFRHAELVSTSLWMRYFQKIAGQTHNAE